MTDHVHGSWDGRLFDVPESTFSKDTGPPLICYSEEAEAQKAHRGKPYVAQGSPRDINRPSAASPTPFGFLRPKGSWLLHFAGAWFNTAIVFFSIIPPARADSGDDFANNLFSDLAPILALFGEQVAKQFLSESSGWADNVLFAMAPLGVITGIVSAIRVAGHQWLKAIVGRGKEGLALTELELMSSNSPDVGEMWNGQAIIRVFGTPSIFQFIYAPDDLATNPASGISILADGNPFFERTQQKKRLLTQSRGLWNDSDIEMRPLIQSSGDSDTSNQANIDKNPPNISLNARGELISNLEKWLMAIIGIATQLVVLVFEGLISYYPSLKTHFLKNSLSPSRHSFPCAAVGTVSLNVGMLICSYVIDCASTEEDWTLKGSRNCKVAWIQKGGTVSDQVFEPYIIFGHQGQKVIRTSHRCGEKTITRLRWLVFLGTFVSVAGFVIQFIGLRGMHWSATIAQLAATGFMTVVRSFVRRRMLKEPTTAPAVEGYELDFMARSLAECNDWKVVPEHTLPADDDGLANSVLQIRIHLGKLSRWSTDVQDITVSLCAAMERTMNTIYRSKDICLMEDALQHKELSWKLGIVTFNSEKRPHYGELEFKITKSQSWGLWEIDENTKHQLAAVLSLWMLHFREQEKYYRDDVIRSGLEDPRKNPNKSAKVLVWPNHKVDQWHFGLWTGFYGVDIHFGDPKGISKKKGIPRYQFVGELNNGGGLADIATVVIIENISAEKLFAQQIFSDFLSAVIPWIDNISGPTEIHQNDKRKSDDQEIRNNTLTQLAKTICETGLGTQVEILMDILSILGKYEKLPEREAVPVTSVTGLDLYTENSKRRSRTSNHWHRVALHIQKSIGNHEWVSFPRVGQLEAWCAWQMAARFCKRILALAGSSEGGSNDDLNHPQSLFLKWLEGISKDDCPSFPEDLPSQHYVTEFPSNTLGTLDTEMIAKIHKLLAPFGPAHPALAGDGEMVLLRESMNIATRQGLSRVLEEAVRHGYDSVVEALMDRKIDTQQAYKIAESPLVLAASQGHNSVVQLLLLQLELHFPKEYRQFQAGYQPIPLWSAAICGHISTVQLLLMYMTGANEMRYQECALILAAGKGHTDITYRREVNTREAGEWGISWWGQDEDVDARPGVAQRQVVLLTGTRAYYQASIAHFLKKGNIRALSEAIMTRTALQAAAEGGHLDVVNRLLEDESAANAEPAGYAGRTALQAAAGGGHQAVVDRLLEHGANVNAEPAEHDGRTALQAAAGGGHQAVVDRLLEHGANVNAEPARYGGRTALQAAAGGGHQAVVDRLLEHGANVNAEPAWGGGRTALQAAAGGGHQAVVDRLLEHGANVNAEPVRYGGRTALQAAAGGGHQAVVDRLRNAGAL